MIAEESGRELCEAIHFRCKCGREGVAIRSDGGLVFLALGGALPLAPGQALCACNRSVALVELLDEGGYAIMIEPADEVKL